MLLRNELYTSHELYKSHMSDMPRPLIDTPDVSHELHISNELYESHINDMPRPQIDDSEARTMYEL